MAELPPSDSPETPTVAALTPPAEKSSPASKSARGLAALALLLSLVAVVAAGYLYWPNAEDDAVAMLVPRIDDTERRLAARVDALAAELAGVQDELTQARDENARMREALTQARSALADAVAAAVNQAPPSAREWQLAEVEYLLRIANHRLRMEGDAPGALQLLTASDDILRQVDAVAFHVVRARLADEMAALRAFKGADVQGVFLRLEAIKESLGGLPLRLPEYVQANVESAEAPQPSADGDATLLESLARRLSGLVRFRQHDGAAPLRPLLPPDQAEYLEQHLRLALDRAQLAALRGDQTVFRASLTAAGNWLREFLNANHQTVAHLASELDALLAIDLSATPPDISQSLERLKELRRTRLTPPVE